MARKSRSHLIVPKLESTKYQTGVYLRLSVEDDENNAIQSQRLIAEEYLEKHDDLILFKSYVDNGVSSFDTIRPAFDEMMQDIKHGIINCVVVKDVSRFGRNYIESAEYIENIFPFMNIRFISIAEYYDSLLSPTADMSVLLKTLINNAYSWDISEKVKSVIRNKQQNGSYVPAKLPYGYKKERTEFGVQWVKDKDREGVVLKIFTFSANGKSAYEIAGLLNQNEIPSPNDKLWTASAVSRIIKNRAYIGEFITGKTQNELTSMRSIKKVDSAEQIVFKGHHAPIVSWKLFSAAQNNQQLPMANSTMKNEIADPFSGKMFCDKCGRKMKRKIYRGKRENIYYICPTYEEAKGSCDKNRITLEKLRTDIFDAIKIRIDDAVMLNESIKEERFSLKYKLCQQYIEDKIFFLRSEIEKHKKLKIKAFEDYSLLSGFEKDDYINKFKYEKETVDYLQDVFGDIIKVKSDEIKQADNTNKEIERFLKYSDKVELTEDMIRDFVDKVLINEGSVWVDIKDYFNDKKRI